MKKIPDEIKDVPYDPTPAEKSMANSINFLVQCMLRGELSGIALCAVNTDGEPSTFYYNKSPQAVLRGPMEQLRVMYESHRDITKLTNAPENNKSWRRH